MKYHDFEDYLAYVHADQYVGLDDLVTEDFAEWLENLGSEDMIYYANKYAHAVEMNLLAEMEKSLCR